MNIITATWMDDLGQIFCNEYYTEDTDVQDILDFYRQSKLVYKKTVISEGDETLVFSDGSRVVLELRPVETGFKRTEEVTVEVIPSHLLASGMFNG